MAKSASQTENMQDVPIFLRKTYELIRTCDPAVACWSEDGETFIVKDPVQFETTVIPQFFKHNKFTSFVRQLNFYSFRKIKFIDSIRIDPKLEAETANYWRFRHEHFRRDRPDLLSQIKRMNSAPRNPSAAATAAAAAVASAAVAVPTSVASSTTAGAKPNAVPSAAVAVATVTDKAVTTEVQILKKRIEEMNKNLGELTAMVQKVNLKQEEQETSTSDSAALPGTKRKKVEQPPTRLIAEPVVSGGAGILADLPGEYYRPEDAQQDAADLFPDGMVSSMDLDDMPVLPMPEPMSVMNSEREISDTTGVSDIEFVDQLLNAFGDESEGEAPSVAAVDAAFRMEQEQPVAAVVVPVTTAAVAARATASVPEITTIHNKNLPDPELMQRLGEALMMLPKDIQEMIVDRLIQAITSPSFLQQQNAATSVSTPTNPSAVVPEMLEEDEEAEEEQMKQPSKVAAALSQESSAATPLAAATLAALLHHYSAQMGSSNKTCNSKSGVATKTLPVIPVHA